MVTVDLITKTKSGKKTNCENVTNSLTQTFLHNNYDDKYRLTHNYIINVYNINTTIHLISNIYERQIVPL